MMMRGTVTAVLAAVTIVGGVAAGAVLHHNESQATAQTAHAERTQRVAAMHAVRRLAWPRPAARVHAAASYRIIAFLPATGVRAGRLAQLRWRVLRSDYFAIAAPHAPWALAQVGGREPSGRLLPAGALVNGAAIEIVMRMSSRESEARLQPYVELRPLGQPLIGRPTALGPIVAYHGRVVRGVVHVAGLRDGVAYHWQALVHDRSGVDSPWRAFGSARGADLRVALAVPAAPRAGLAGGTTPAQWVGTRSLTFHWSAPTDPTGIRGYAYTLDRSPTVRPALRLSAVSRGVVLQAPGDGLWYFTVRALNEAHTWGPAAQVAVRIDTAVPRLQVLSAATGPVNPRRAGPLLRLRQTQWARVALAVIAPDGRVADAIHTALHRPGATTDLTWDGRLASGAPAPNGRYTVRISAVNRAGVAWSATRQLTLMDVAPTFTGYGLTQPYVYNPFNNVLDGDEAITATLDATASVSVEAVSGTQVMRSWQFGNVAPGHVITATWDGTLSSGVQAPAGTYAFTATAVDAAGNITKTALGSVVLDHRRIIVSLDGQQLWALDGDHVLLSTLVTTGGPIAPTPTGDFQIIDRESPFTFKSEYPKTSILWYPPSKATFALLFQWNGYFIHDAPWRGYFGPGSNSVAGRPGTNTTGTHGCVNVPYYSMAWLFNWATMYTPVEVRQSVTPGKWPQPLSGQ